MSQILTDGNTKVTFVPAMASLTGPTLAELNAAGGVSLENTLTDDGLSIDYDEGAVTGPTLASVQDFEGPGRIKANIELTGYRDSSPSSDRMWSVMVRGTTGYLVVRTGVAATTAWAAGQKVDVFSVTCGERRKVPVERESYEKFAIKMFASSTYNIDSTVAA